MSGRSTLRLALIAAAATVAGCAFISPNATDIPEAHIDLTEPFSFTGHDEPLPDANALVEKTRWEQAVPVTMIMTDFTFGPGELTFRSGVPYALRIRNQGIWPHAFDATHFFRAIAVRNIEPAPFDGPAPIDGVATTLIPDPYGPSAVYLPVSGRAALAPIRGAHETSDAAAGPIGEAAIAVIPEPPFEAIVLEPNQAVIVYFLPVRAGTYYLRSVRTERPSARHAWANHHRVDTASKRR